MSTLEQYESEVSDVAHMRRRATIAYGGIGQTQQEKTAAYEAWMALPEDVRAACKERIAIVEAVIDAEIEAAEEQGADLSRAEAVDIALRSRNIAREDYDAASAAGWLP